MATPTSGTSQNDAYDARQPVSNLVLNYIRCQETILAQEKRGMRNPTKPIHTRGPRLSRMTRIGTCDEENCPECPEQLRTIAEQAMTDLRYTSAMSVEAAERIIKEYSRSIFDDLEYLKATLESHGDIIANRWKKKDRKKRESLLKRALPQMYDTSDFLIWANQEMPRQICKNYRSSFLLPYLNCERLKTDSRWMLALLHARTSFEPYKWTAFDKNETSIGWYQGYLEVDHSDCTVSLCPGNYGQIVPWDKTLAHQWAICAFPRAKIIFEAQALLMGFLRRFVEDLTKGAEATGSVTWDDSAQNWFQEFDGKETWSAFTNKAFTSPEIDFTYLLDLAKGKYYEAFDKIWLLQTDVLYMSRHVKLRTHCHRAFRNEHAGWLFRHVVLSNQFWKWPLRDLQEWAWLVEELEYTASLLEHHREHLGFERQLPDDLDFALGCLELALLNQFHNKGEQLILLLSQLAGFQNYFIFTQEDNDNPITRLKDSPHGNIDAYYTTDPLFWCLLVIAYDKGELVRIGAEFMFQYLDEQILKETAEKKNRVDSRLLEHLSYLSALCELLSTVRHYRPMCNPTTVDRAQVQCKDRGNWRCLGLFSEKLLVKAYDADVAYAVGSRYDLIDGSPTPSGPRDKKWLEKVDDLRKVSTQYWECAWVYQERILSAAKAEGKCNDDDISRIRTWLSFGKTPEHNAALAAERTRILAPKPKRALLGSKSDLVDSPLEWASKTEDQSNTHTTFQPPKVKCKPKTKGGSSTTPQVSSADPTPNMLRLPTSIKPRGIPMSTIVRIELSAKSLGILSRLYPVTLSEYAAKPVDWKDFVAAMADAGFHATSSSGSAVAFIRQEAGGGRISFHRPHPISKIEQIWLLCWGKRMAKWFGWGREVLAERGKENEENKNVSNKDFMVGDGKLSGES